MYLKSDSNHLYKRTQNQIFKILCVRDRPSINTLFSARKFNFVSEVVRVQLIFCG